MSRTTLPQARLNNVQALRAIAALMVVGAHLVTMERKSLPGADPFLKWFEPVGFTGVDLFFVISGFVIITSTWSSFGRPGIGLNFILRRAARIFPVYWTVLLPLALLDVFTPSLVLSSQTVRPELLASFALLPQPGLPLLTASWSLVYEMYFYYIYSFAIMRPVAQLPWFMGIWVVFTAVIFALFPHTTLPYLSHLGNTITYEFVFGMVIGWRFVHGCPSQLSLPAITVGVVAITALAIFLPDHHNAHYGAARFLVVGLPMALILYGFVGLEINKTFVFGSWLVLLGDASYSMYLWHVPILAVMTRLSLHREILRSPIVHFSWLASALILVVVSALVLYHLIERPLVRAFGHLLHLGTPGTILRASLQTSAQEHAT